MKKLFFLLYISLFCLHGFCQDQKQIPGLKNRMTVSGNDTSLVLILDSLCRAYGNSNTDSAIFCGRKALDLTRKIRFLRGESNALASLGRVERILGNMPKALELAYMALQIAEEHQYKLEIYHSLNIQKSIYTDLMDFNKAQQCFNQLELILDENNLQPEDLRYDLYLDESWLLRKWDKLDSSIFYLQKAEQVIDPLIWQADNYYWLVKGNSQFKLGQYPVAIESLSKSLHLYKLDSNHRGISWASCSIAEVYQAMNERDSSIQYAKKGLSEAQKIDMKNQVLRAGNILAELYDSIDSKQALVYQKIARSANDEIYGAGKVLELQRSITDEQERQRKKEADIIFYANRLRLYAMLSVLVVLLVIGIILYRNNRQKHEANIVLGKTLSELKSTQSQLIQSEKMASLGELTAGIAHEIQNPLNFVNNFSELSNELITEMNEEIDKGNTDEVKAIANDIKQNLDKINHHGKRADSIVKGMLQHSQKGSGQKEPTDINAMAEEYLRLAYHGCLAKDITLNASFVTDLDKSIGNVNLVQQDISRVLLNLYNNAFYALSAKASAESFAKDEALAKADSSYQPTVTLTTKRKDGFIEISVKDNGGGIPENIKDKIFQPFFTTKPTGQGTGLGLSLSYDIIKAHQGTINIKNTPGAGAEFIITLPINA